MSNAMQIAILGATSQIAKDLIVSFVQNTDYQCVLFSRSPEKVVSWSEEVGLTGVFSSHDYVDFKHGDYDCIINFVGVGDPARAKAMGSMILDITYQYDQLALDYIRKRPSCKYIFLSSGAVYGDIFSEPATEYSMARIPINQLDETYWYAMAKLYAEAKHRAFPELSIVDVRVFNYFSHTQDMSARFFITDVMRAIQSNKVLKTSAENIVRDFLRPSDFFQLIDCLLASPKTNIAVDCYTNSSVSKLDLLQSLEKEFGLCYETIENRSNVNATGSKLHYYSLNKVAERFGYKPQETSISGVFAEIGLVLDAR